MDRATGGDAVTPSRLFDLVYHQRHALHDEGLISDEEYAALVEHGAGAARRLEAYDDMQARLSVCASTVAPGPEASESAHDAEETALATAQPVLQNAITLSGQRPTERDRALLGSRNLTVRALAWALFSHGCEPTFWFRTTGRGGGERS